MGKDESRCWIGIFTTIQIIIISGLFAIVLVPLLSYYEFNEAQCNITNIEYPSVLPSSNNTNNWKSCDCGKGCTTWTPCIKLYSSINPNVVIQKDFYKENNNGDECTFYDKKCNDGEDIIVTQQKLIDSIELFKKYNDSNVKCFFNNEKTEIYLNRQFNIDVLIILLIGFSITCCCCSIQIFIYYDCKCNKNTKTDTQIYFDSSSNNNIV